MKRTVPIIMFLTLLSLACSLGGLSGGQENPATTQTPALQSEKRCGDGVCDGPENTNNCPKDCPAGLIPAEDQAAPGEQEVPKSDPPETSGELVTGVIYAETSMDRKPGTGDCGVEPWYSADCPMGVKVWWEVHLKALASTPVLIIPDGQDRWVITNHSDVTQKYSFNLDDYDYSPYVGKYSEISINPAATNPECTATIEGSDFDFQVMGTREEGLTELIFSANPVEHINGNCGGASFNWETHYLLYDWAAALTRDPMNLSFQMNDTFQTAPGTYVLETQIDTNPSPENRDHVTTTLEFMCMGQEAEHVMAPVACPWEKQ